MNIQIAVHFTQYLQHFTKILYLHLHYKLALGLISQTSL